MNKWHKTLQAFTLQHVASHISRWHEEAIWQGDMKKQLEKFYVVASISCDKNKILLLECIKVGVL